MAGKPTQSDTSPKNLIKRKICYLLERLSPPLSPAHFPVEYQRDGFGDQRQPAQWVAGNSSPNRHGLRNLAEFFTKRLGAEFPVRLFEKNYDFSQFDAWFTERHADVRKRVEIALPYTLRAISDSAKRDLIGTYHLYRYSLRGDLNHPNIIREVMIIKDAASASPLLDLKIHAFPARSGDKHIGDGVDGAKRAETFEGHLYWFGGCFYGTVSFSDGDRDHRIRHLLFPELEVGTRAFTYVGLVSGFSATLGKAVSVKAVANKISHRADWTVDGTSHLRRYEDAKHTDIEHYAALIDNHIAKRDSVLTTRVPESGMKSLQLETIDSLGLPEDPVPPRD